MMFYIVFTLVWINCPIVVHCNNTISNNTILTDNKTEIAVLAKNYTIFCPILTNDEPLETIIWNLSDGTLIPVPVGKQGDNDVTQHYRGGPNGSLVIDKVTYADSKAYVCKGYGRTHLFSVQITLVVRGPPNNISDFSYQSISDTVLAFSWDITISNSNLVNSFNLTLCKSLITKDCVTVSINFPTRSYVFKNLKSFTEYRASIIAINNIGFSKRADLLTRTQPGTPTAHPFIVSKTVESRNVTLIIECAACLEPEKINGVLESYLITYRDFENRSKILKSNETRITVPITGLLPYMNYTFNISVFNGAKYGPIDSVHCKTKEDFPNPSTFFRVVDVTSNSVTVKWNPADDKFGPITGYVIKVMESKESQNLDNPLKTFDVNRTVEDLVINELSTYTYYTIFLYSKNNVGLSKSVSAMAQTDREVPSAPQILSAKKVDNSVHISWTIQKSLHTNFSYKLCYNYDLIRKIDHCVQIKPDGKDFASCRCLANETVHSVDIPIVRFASNESQISFRLQITIPSVYCSLDCRLLESSFSKSYTVKLNEYLKYSKNVIENSVQYHLIIGLASGFTLIFILSFLCAFVICKNGAKYFCFSSRQNMYYTRPNGEYIEVCTRQHSISKILPLEKCPYPPIPMSNLIEHIHNHRADDGAGFQAEFETIESIDTSKWSITHAVLKDNKCKNRYTNIFPYDHSRVILQSNAFGKFDYVNASFIDGFQRPHAYIATQGPLLETVPDFWQMVWEQNSEIIVMISNFMERGRTKCEMYWAPNESVNYRNISVRHVYQKEMAFYTERRFRIRNIRLKKNTKERIVYHYQYTDWRDFDVPPSSLPVLVFIRATTKHWLENSGPIVVHCSAGVGRTGTYICIESQIRQLDVEHQVNVRGFLEHIRQQRMKLVQTESQYTFIHDALYEYFLYPDREIHKLQLSNYISKLKEPDCSGCLKLETQFKKCINFEPNDYDYMESKKRHNIVKNRSKVVMPIESRRINLSSEPGVEGSNYINASAIQGYWQMKEFIITQHPLDETEHDFWRMVWDENCSMIVLLSTDIYQFWPGEDDNTRTFMGFRVAQCSSEETEFSIQFNFLMSSSREDYALDCTMHCLKNWPTTISDSGKLLRLLFEISSKKYNGPIVVIDEFGSSRAGIFVAMSSLLHQLKNDDVVNVYFVMKMIHIERPYTFSSSNDLLFIYELLEYVISNQHLYSFFSRPHQEFIPNGIAHVPVTQKQALNNNTNLSIIHYSTLGTVRSKSSTSTSRRRASSVDSEPYGIPTPSPSRKETFGNRISWNVGETRHIGTPLLSDSFMDWPNSVCNGHFNGPNTNASFENPHSIDLPVAKIISHPTASQNPQSSIYTTNSNNNNNNNTSSSSTSTNNGALDTSLTSNTVWCTQKL